MQEPTRIISSNRATLIDLALVSNVNYIQDCSVITPLANSDHNGISLAIKRKKSAKSSTRRQVWKYSQADFPKASDLIEETDWEHLFHGKSVDEACCIWQEKFLSIMEQCIPKGVLPLKRNIPWASRNIRRIILKKNIAYRRYKRSRDTLSGQQYKHLRNRAVKELRKAKKQYISNLSKAPNTKQFWAAIKSLNGSKSTRIPTLM